VNERAERTIVRTSCPRDCYDGCGVAVIKRGERIVKVLGDPDHPVSRGALCGKCAVAYNGAWRDPALRLSRPLRRCGAKGEGAFRPIGWDEALDEIAGRLRRLLADAGPASLWHAHYTGTCSLIAGSFPMRFFNRLGAGEVEPDSICNLAGQVALEYLYGTAATGFDPRSAAAADCLLLWGINPSASAPHAHKHWLKETAAKLVVVDPIATPTAQAADLHLQPFPGTDAVLAFALLHVLQREGLTDRGFIDRHTLGWEEIAPDIAATTPERAAAITGVPAARIEAAARLYGAGPALLWLGQGLQRQPLGGNVMRACALLPAATGNLGRRGGGFCYLNGSGRKGIDQDYLTAPHLRAEPVRKLSHMDLAAALGDRARSRALFCWNINIAASNPQQELLRQGLRRDDLFLVVADLFLTDTARFADLVLPAASFLEFDDMTSPYFHLSLGAQVKATTPPGEALPNQEIFRRLARAMGYSEPEHYESDVAILDALAAQAGIAGGFAALAAAGSVMVSPEPVVQFADRRFPTPSGKVEIASARAQGDGHPRTPRPLADPRPTAGRLRLLSPASPWLMNSSYGNDPRIAALAGAPAILLHPDDAAGRGLAEGMLAAVANETGSLLLPVRCDPLLPRGVALSPKGAWPQAQPGGRNINWLNPGRKSDMGESSAVHAVEVTVAPA
jgi:anaerobic selenocysteine-containing dehydrogenase